MEVNNLTNEVTIGKAEELVNSFDAEWVSPNSYWNELIPQIWLAQPEELKRALVNLLALLMDNSLPRTSVPSVLQFPILPGTEISINGKRPMYSTIVRSVFGYCISWLINQELVTEVTVEGNIHFRATKSLQLEKRALRSTRDKPKSTPEDTMGGIFTRDTMRVYPNLYRCQYVFNRLAYTPFKISSELFRGINLGAIDKIKGNIWIKENNSNCKGYEKFREEQYSNYLKPLSKEIEENQLDKVSYNTYAPDSRGRIYPTTDCGNYVGIKQIRYAVVAAEPKNFTPIKLN